MLSLVPGVRVMSEPFSLYNAHLLRKKGIIPAAKYEPLVRALVRLQVKQPHYSQGIKHQGRVLQSDCHAHNFRNI